MTKTDNTTVDTKKKPSWGGTAIAISKQLAAEGFPRGDLAALRRMPPGATHALPFWRLAAQHRLLGNETIERKWALIIHGIALMTPTGGGQGAHDKTRVGSALYLGVDTARSTAFYSEARLARLLSARGSMLHTLLARMFRMLASADARFDWGEMARFVLTEGYDEQKTGRSRHRIARSYYQEERKHHPPTSE